MNLIIFVTLSVISLRHFGDSSVWPIRADARSSSSHQVVRRAALPYWLRALREGGRSSSNGSLRKNREAEDLFSAENSPAVAERYIQQAQNGKVIASNGKAGNNMGDTMIFGDGVGNADKAVVNGADYPLESGASIDFGVHDRMKNRSPQRPGCKKSGSATPGDSDPSGSEAADVSPSVDFIDQPDWAPLVNESQCQSYGPSQFCENVTNYPAEAISRILMSDNGSLLTTFFADNTKMFPSASESDESMVLAQRKPGAAAHAINTRIKPLESTSGDILNLCESMTEFKFPKSAKNNQNQMLTIVNQDNISQPITVETCRGENQPCNYAENFPAGFKAVCMQKYVTHHLAALRNGKIVREAFTFPSCCVCVLKLWDPRADTPVSVARRAVAGPSASIAEWQLK